MLEGGGELKMYFTLVSTMIFPDNSYLHSKEIFCYFMGNYWRLDHNSHQ